MAKYTQGQRGAENSGQDWSGLKNVVYGASEAPRVHGLTGAQHTKTPRFKNHYIVRFQYTESMKPHGAFRGDPKKLIDITHRVKAVDAPRFDIETETMNQYNKPRIIPLKINYQPITMTFWDDRSDISNDFWTSTYEFYFKNGTGRHSAREYGVRDSDIIYEDHGIVKNVIGYDNYGYDIKAKINKKNLFQYMSLYLIQNSMASRIDLINPYIQSMQHDQFSQDMSNELAQNTITWGYENVVYYSQQTIDAVDGPYGGGWGVPDQDLLSLLKGDQNIFNWQDRMYWESNSNWRFGADFQKPKAKKDALPNTPPPGTTGSTSALTAARMANSFAELEQITENAQMRPRKHFSSTEADTEFLSSAGLTRSNINRVFSEEYKHLAHMAIGNSLTNNEEVTAVDDFSAINTPGSRIEEATEVDSFAAIPTDGNALDKTATTDKQTGPQAGTNNKPTAEQTPGVWINPNTGQPVVAVGQQSTAQVPSLVQRAVAEWNSQTPAQQQQILKDRANRREAAEKDRR